MSPVTEEEARRLGLPAGHPIDERLRAKLARSIEGPVEDLVDRGVITSGEVLARVIPQLTAQVAGAGIADPELRRLHGAIYQAFARRRSLLLLNLESQVKRKELPWVRAIDPFRTDEGSAREKARRELERIAVLAMTAFPHQILPNKLLQEIRSLAEAAGLSLPIVDEVAADIFMGEFSEKYLRAARKAAELLGGTLYERYYGIPYAEVRRIDDIRPSRHGAATSPAFIRLCHEMAGEVPGVFGQSPARNGKIIEQEQILTTHNLAVLFDALGLTGSLRPRLDKLARSCFEWICRRQEEKVDYWPARLQMVKNTAYAWRQMVFFLALLPSEEVESFLAWAGDHLAKGRPEFRDRFRPALEGLVLVAGGGSLDGEGRRGWAGEGRRFLGWTTERHWLLGPGS